MTPQQRSHRVDRYLPGPVRGPRAVPEPFRAAAENPAGILGFVALEVPRAGTDPQTSDDYVRRMWAFFAALPPGEFPHTVDLAAQLARSSTDDQFQFGIRTFLAGLHAQAS